jgi:ribosome-binding factor A
MAREYSRSQRISKLLQEEIARLLQREVKDARIGLVVVTGVEVTPDLKHATVYVEAPGAGGREAEVLAGLASAAGFMRTRLGRSLRIRRAPELHFQIDRTQERAARIRELLAGMDVEEDASPDGEES